MMQFRYNGINLVHKSLIKISTDKTLDLKTDQMIKAR